MSLSLFSIGLYFSKNFRIARLSFLASSESDRHLRRSSSISLIAPWSGQVHPTLQRILPNLKNSSLVISLRLQSPIFITGICCGSPPLERYSANVDIHRNVLGQVQPPVLIKSGARPRTDEGAEIWLFWSDMDWLGDWRKLRDFPPNFD